MTTKFILLVRVLVLITIALSVGCANPYAKYYQDNLGGKTITQIPAYVPHDGQPAVYNTKNMDEEARTLQEDGYDCIGISSFNAGDVDSDKAFEHGKHVGAAIILIQRQYLGTLSGAAPLTTVNPSKTITSSHQGMVYGSGSYGNYFGTSTTTIPGGLTTQYIPYSVNKYDYLASYWIKTKQPILGINYSPLNDEAKKQIQSNKGVVVRVVIKKTPAFDANLLPGDIITKIGDDYVKGSEEFTDILSRYAGQEVPLEIYRSGMKKLVVVRLNQSSY